VCLDHRTRDLPVEGPRTRGPPWHDLPVGSACLELYVDDGATLIGLRELVRLAVRLGYIGRRSVHHHVVPGVPRMPAVLMGRVSRMVVVPGHVIVPAMVVR
jgi:hypothetical protein